MSGWSVSRPSAMPAGGSRCCWRVVCPPPSLKALEGKLRAELNVARVIALRGHKAEGRVGRGRRAGVETDPVAEVRVVERVNRFGADLQPLALAHAEVLREREVRNR